MTISPGDRSSALQCTMGDRSIARNPNRCGILIFVSLAERYARIIADDEIAKRVPQSRWQAAVDALSYVLPHGEEEAYTARALAHVEPFVSGARSHAAQPNSDRSGAGATGIRESSDPVAPSR